MFWRCLCRLYSLWRFRRGPVHQSIMNCRCRKLYSHKASLQPLHRQQRPVRLEMSPNPRRQPERPPPAGVCPQRPNLEHKQRLESNLRPAHLNRWRSGLIVL
jgi:hypothetical protein